MAIIKMQRQLEVQTLEDYFEDFVRNCKSRNLSDATIMDYTKQFNKFNQWYHGDTAEIDEDTVIDYVEFLKPTMKPVSVNTSLRHMKAIFNYFSSHNYMQPCKINFLKFQEELKECYTEDELKALLKKPDVKVCNFTAIRTWAVINFFIGTGCRVQTLSNVLIKDVNFQEDSIYYRHTKNKKAQYVPLSPILHNVLMEYLRFRKGKPDDLLFPSENNTKLLETTITHNIKMYCKKRNVREGNSHLFRHTFTKNWILQGGDSLKLQRILGHSSLKMVEHYANLFKADLKVGFDQFNLLERLTTQKIKM